MQRWAVSEASGSQWDAAGCCVCSGSVLVSVIAGRAPFPSLSLLPPSSSSSSSLRVCVRSSLLISSRCLGPRDPPSLSLFALVPAAAEKRQRRIVADETMGRATVGQR